MTEKVTKNGSTTVLTEQYTYVTTAAGKPTGQVLTCRTISPGRDVTYTYSYDSNGNIATVSDGTHTTRYSYDSANQLTREDNQAAGKSWTYTYDDAGNILSKAEYAYTTGTLGTAVSTVSYAYGDTSWGDLLTGYGGKTVTSDTAGNMTGDGTWTYTWEHGRELSSMTGGGTTWSFTYDADGMRTRRTNGSTTYSYVYNGGALSRMTVGSTTLDFRYDASGTPMTVTYGGTTYYYATNLQGDVVAILNNSGTAVVAYTYDAWGNVLTTTGSLASTLGTHNPLRYRGYVYDTETGLYYLQSRYYDPTTGRFINTDAYASTGQGILGNNMFAYCNNSPTSFTDHCGGAPIQSNTHCQFDGLLTKGGVFDQYMELIASFEAVGVTLYNNKDGALNAWSKKYLPLSQEYEYVTFLYSIETPLGIRYFTTSTFRGTKQNGIISANVLWGTAMLAIQDSISSATLLAHVHTHPDPGIGYHNDFPSVSPDIYGGDRIVYIQIKAPGVSFADMLTNMIGM